MKKKTNLKKYKKVYVVWKDAQSDAEWGDERDIKEWANKDFHIFEMGWLIEENDKNIVISNQVCEDGDIGNRTKIPKAWIVEMYTVSIVKRKRRKK